MPSVEPWCQPCVSRRHSTTKPAQPHRRPGNWCTARRLARPATRPQSRRFVEHFHASQRGTSLAHAIGVSEEPGRNDFMPSLPRPTRARTRLTIALAAAALAIATSGAAQTRPPPMPTPASGPNHDLARQHLTAARNALSDLTQLPAAGQLAGNPRRLVQELITDFNAMLTIDAGWHASYERVDADARRAARTYSAGTGRGHDGRGRNERLVSAGERHRPSHPRQAPGVPRASRPVRRCGEW